jgi:hypothetical protein
MQLNEIWKENKFFIGSILFLFVLSVIDLFIPTGACFSSFNNELSKWIIFAYIIGIVISGYTLIRKKCSNPIVGVFLLFWTIVLEGFVYYLGLFNC